MRTLPDRLRATDTFELNIEALQRCQRRRRYAVSAIDAGTWQSTAEP